MPFKHRLSEIAAKVKAEEIKAPIRLEVLRLKDVKPNDYNPNIMGETAFKKLAESVKKVGYIEPILVRYDEGRNKYIIIDGEHRYYLLKHAGIEEAPFLIADIPEEKAVLATGLIDTIRGKFDSDEEAYREYLKLLEETVPTELLEGFFDDDIEALKAAIEEDEEETQELFDHAEIEEQIENVKREAFTVMLSRENMNVVKTLIEKYKRDLQMTDEEAFMKLIKAPITEIENGYVVAGIAYAIQRDLEESGESLETQEPLDSNENQEI